MDTQAYLNALEHARQCGTEWPRQYAIDCGWDADSVRLTAELGPSDYDIDALGVARAKELEQWCKKHQERESC